MKVRNWVLFAAFSILLSIVLATSYSARQDEARRKDSTIVPDQILATADKTGGVLFTRYWKEDKQKKWKPTTWLVASLGKEEQHVVDDNMLALYGGKIAPSMEIQEDVEAVKNVRIEKTQNGSRCLTFEAQLTNRKRPGDNGWRTMAFNGRTYQTFARGLSPDDFYLP